MLKIKVGMMPGKLIEVVVEQGSTAREIFEVAGVELSNHEIRLDGEKIDLDRTIHNGNLLVAMKMIKGNMPSIKVGLMPGKLTTVEFNQGDSARQIFDLAGIEISNHEIRLDGNKIDIDSSINNGGLLVGMKQIKGNAEYVSDCSEEEIEILLENKLPKVIDKNNVGFVFDMVKVSTDTDTYLLDKDVFYSVYTLHDEPEEGTQAWELKDVYEEEKQEEDNAIEHVCKCFEERKRVIDKIDLKIAEIESDIEYYERYKRDCEMKLQALLEVKRSL